MQLMCDPNADFQNLAGIQNKFLAGEYQSTFKLAGDVRKMWANYRILFKDDHDKQEKISDIQKYSDELTQKLDIENKSLAAPQQPVIEQPVQPAPPQLVR